MSEFKFIDLADSLPPCISRQEVPKVLKGVIAAKTLANEDSKGTGPPKKIRFGRRVIYETKSLLAWLDSRK